MSKGTSQLIKDVNFHLKQRANLTNIYSIIGHLDLIKDREKKIKIAETEIKEAQAKIKEIQDGATPTNKTS